MGLEDAAIRFREALDKKLKSGNKAHVRMVTCKTVDWDNQTMVGIGLDDSEFLDISLGYGYRLLKPVIGSDCIIVVIEGEDSLCSLLDASEVELIQYNGGELGGLVKIEELTNKLNELKDSLNNLVDSYNKHTHNVTTNGSATTQNGITLVTSIIAKKATSFSVNDYEDKNITH